jgi:hypothetical protein
MARPLPKTLDHDLMARIITDAEILGNERAAKKHGCSVRTVERYRGAYRAEPSVAEKVAAKRKSIDDDWRNEAVAFLKAATEKLGTLVAQAGPEQIREVAGAIKIVGELTVAKDVLGGDGEQSRTDSAHEAPEEVAEGPEASESGTPVH